MDMSNLSEIKQLHNATIDYADSRYKAAFALNLCTVSVSQIVDYDDIVILEQEYEAILNNLNFEQIPKDEALLKILKQLLDTITFFRIQEEDKNFVDREYQNRMKNAIWSAVPNLGFIVAGGNPVTMAVSLASQVGIGYMNYRKAKAENAFAYEKQMWQLQRAAIEQFNGLRRELFDTAWRLVDTYRIPDEYRLTERQVKQYNEILMDPDAVRRYERLSVIKESFVAYPPFWYFFGNTANAIARTSDGAEHDYYTEAAKRCYEIFISAFSSSSLLREYQVASSCALEYIDLLSKDVPSELEKINGLISFAVKMSGNANDVLQMCAFAYLKIGQTDRAAELFRRLVNENYNAVLNGQLLSGYYVSKALSGDILAVADYGYLNERIDEEYLFPMPTSAIAEKKNDYDTYCSICECFLNNQKGILTKKYGLVLETFREKYRIAFNRCIPVPGEKRYNDAYFCNTVDAYAARKADGVSLKNRKECSQYVSCLQDCDYPYNYLTVLNDLLNASTSFAFVQGNENSLYSAISTAIVKNREKLKDIRSKMDEPVRFTIDTYNELIEVSYDEYTQSFFDLLSDCISVYIDSKKDIVSMNDAEMNLREFCIQQAISTPDILYDTADDLTDEQQVKKQYFGIELIDEGITIAEVSDRFGEVKKKIQGYGKVLDINRALCSLLIKGDEAFERYLIRQGLNRMNVLCRKTVAIIDDTSSKDNDLLLTTDGIIQIVRGKVKEAIPYDEVEVTADHKTILLHQAYSNPNIDMVCLVQLISSLRLQPYLKMKERKTPFELIDKIKKK